MKLFVMIFFVFNLWASDSFVGGNQSYDKGDYEKAEKLYLSSQMESGEKFYNLGSIYHRKGEIGKAIFYLKRAKDLLPRDGDVIFNLTYLRNKSLDKIEYKKGMVFLSFKNFLNHRESLILVSLLALLFWIMSILYLYRKGEILLWTRRAFLILFMLSLTVLGKDWVTEKDFGVIISPKINVYSAIGRDNVVLFSLHEGAEFNYERIVDDAWVQISLLDGKKGWVKKEHVLI